MEEKSIACDRPVGQRGPESDFYNDLEILATAEHFFFKFKLNKIRVWHIPGETCVGIELDYINPSNNELMRPGPHIGYTTELNIACADLQLDLDEYVVDFRGAAKSKVDFLHFRTNKGRYAEFGNPNAQGRFRYRIPSKSCLIALMVGLSFTLEYIEIATMPVDSMNIFPEPEVSMSAYYPMCPSIVYKSRYYGVEKQNCIMVDDFYSLDLHSTIKRKTSKIAEVNALVTSKGIFGLEVVYLVNGNYETTNYNYQNAYGETDFQRQLFQVAENDSITGASVSVSSNGITSVTFETFKRRAQTLGRKKGDLHQVSITHGCEVVATRGYFSSSGLLGLVFYYV